MLLKNKYATTRYGQNTVLIRRLIDQRYLLFCGKFNEYFNGKVNTLYGIFYILYITIHQNKL